MMPNALPQCLQVTGGISVLNKKADTIKSSHERTCCINQLNVSHALVYSTAKTNGYCLINSVHESAERHHLAFSRIMHCQLAYAWIIGIRCVLIAGRKIFVNPSEAFLVKLYA